VEDQDVHRSIPKFILIASVVILLTFGGLAGYNYNRKLRDAVAASIGSSVATSLSIAIASMPIGPDVTHSLISTPTGIVSKIVIRNNDKELYTEVRITGLQYDSFIARGLPVVVKNIPVGTSKTIKIPVPRKRGTSSMYSKVSFSYSSKSGSGSHLAEVGSAPPPRKKTSPGTRV
jgi:hypothetical protein